MTTKEKLKEFTKIETQTDILQDSFETVKHLISEHFSKQKNVFKYVKYHEIDNALAHLSAYDRIVKNLFDCMLYNEIKDPVLYFKHVGEKKITKAISKLMQEYEKLTSVINEITSKGFTFGIQALTLTKSNYEEILNNRKNKIISIWN